MLHKLKLQQTGWWPEPKSWSGNILSKQQPKNELKAAVADVSSWQLATGSQVGVEHSSSNGGPNLPHPTYSLCRGHLELAFLLPYYK